MSRKAAHTGIVWFSVFVFIAITYMSLAYASPFTRSWDEVDFALALNRYDMLAMQPHFPGYPYFILGATLVHVWIPDPLKALSFFNTLMALSSAIPMTLLVRRFSDTRKGMLFASLVLTSPLLWLMSAQPMSEAAAIAVLWWYLWSIQVGMEHPNANFWSLLPLFLFGFLMGVRVSFFPYGLAILLLWVEQYKRSEAKRIVKRTRLIIYIILAGCFQLVWVAGLVMSEGNVAGFIKLSLAFLRGHFAEWGGGVTSSALPFSQRVTQLFIDNLLWNAVLGHSLLIGYLLILLIIAACVGVWQVRRRKLGWLIEVEENRRFVMLLVSCTVFYTLWVLFGQNIEKPRHITPIVGSLLLFVYIAAVRTTLSRLIYPLLIALISTQLIYGTTLLQRQVRDIPSTYQLHEYLSKLEKPFVLYTWEETRILQYLQADYEHKRIFTYDFFQAEAAANSNRRVLLTNHVLEGFEQQVGSLRNRVRLVAKFNSDTMFDPIYHEILLYEWIGNN